ncbi:MAG: DNA repair and recombination protein RadB [Thermoplasmata archaeon]
MRIDRVSTGCDAFDQLLNGGIEKGHITEIFGEGGSGKTNICIETAITESKKGNKVVYVDTEGISAERLYQILNNAPEETLKNIYFFRSYSIEDQEEMMSKAISLIEEQKDISLIIVDSLTEFYRAELSNGTSTKAKLFLSKELTNLSKISKKRNVAVLVTNQVYLDINTKDIMPLGGYILNHIAKTIILLRKVGRGKREAILQKHRSIEEGRTVTLKITNIGFERDLEDQ